MSNLLRANRLAAAYFMIAAITLVQLVPYRANAAADPYLGTWSLVWQGALDHYTGKLEVAAASGANTYTGNLTLINSSGRIVTQKFILTVSGNEVRIECSEPRDENGAVPSYDPDRFYVVRSGKKMDGYSLDSGGRKGPKIVFTRL